MTVYSNFGSKEGLFQAVVRDRSATVVAGFPGAGALDPDQPEKALLAIGARFLALARGDARARCALSTASRGRSRKSAVRYTRKALSV